MIWTIIGIISAVVSIGALQITWYFEWEKLKKRADQANDNINSLHQNQTVLMSLLKQLHNQVKQNERQTQKDKKEISRQIRVVPSGGNGKTKGPESI